MDGDSGSAFGSGGGDRGRLPAAHGWLTQSGTTIADHGMQSWCSRTLLRRRALQLRVRGQRKGELR